MKSCSQCNVEKDDSEFNKRRLQCKNCQNEYRRIYYQNNTVKVKEKDRLYRQNNLEKLKEKDRLYRQNNVDKERQRNKLYRQNNLDKMRLTSGLYYQNNQAKAMLARAHKRSKHKQIPFDLKEEDIRIPEVCPILNIPLHRGKKTLCPNSPSIDRIVPEKGYIKGNIIIVSSKANTIKSYATPEEIIAVGEFYKKLLEEEKKNDGK
jgi:hypothetical protein